MREINSGMNQGDNLAQSQHIPTRDSIAESNYNNNSIKTPESVASLNESLYPG